MIKFVDSWGNQPVRDWTEAERSAFAKIVELFVKLGQGSELLRRCAGLIDTVKFCVPVKLSIQVKSARGSSYAVLEDGYTVDGLQRLVRAFLGISVGAEAFDKLRPGMWGMFVQNEQFRLVQSYGYRARDPRNGESMICMCPTIFGEVMTSAWVLCEELAHVDSSSRNPRITVKDLELEGVAARRELLSAARASCFSEFQVQITRGELECDLSERDWRTA